MAKSTTVVAKSDKDTARYFVDLPTHVDGTEPSLAKVSTAYWEQLAQQLNCTISLRIDKQLPNTLNIKLTEVNENKAEITAATTANAVKVVSILLNKIGKLG